MSGAWTISYLGPCLLLVSACSRPHPLAQWDPEAFAPSTPDASWSAQWWPAEDRPATPGHALHWPTGEALVTSGQVPDRTGLVGAVDLALERSPETRMAWGIAQANAAQWGIARAAWYPQLRVVFDAMYEQGLIDAGGPDNIQTDRFFAATPSAQVTWTLLDFGRRQARDDATRNALLASNFAFNREIQDVVYSVQAAWFAHEAAQATVLAAQDDLALASSLLTATEERFVVGLATVPDLLEARQQHDLAGSVVSQARTDALDTRTDLLVAMALPPSTPIAFDHDATVPIPEALNIGVERLATLAMSSRPDLSAAIADVRAAEDAIKGAQADFDPIVDLYAGVGYQYRDYRLDPFTMGTPKGHGWNLVWNTGIIGSWLIFDADARKNAVLAARARHETARQALHQLRLEVAGDVYDAYFDWESAMSRYAWAQALVESSTASLEAVQVAHDVGLRTQPQLLAARRGMADARASAINTRAQVLTASARLVHAVGDLKQ